MLTKVIENINEWVDYLEELTISKGKSTYHKNFDPQEFPCIVHSSFHKKKIMDDETGDIKTHRYYKHRFIYSKQAERLLSLV